jgi:hypothetical protein
MKTNMWKAYLAMLICLSIVLNGCTPLRAADQVSTPSVSSANDIALTTADLGDGWVLDAEVSDLNASYYFDTSEDGKAIIGTHRTVQTRSLRPCHRRIDHHARIL